ncbi:hypothetical protein [Pelotomaculum schinkii]|uniref:hypothetical protein n=1 Tax=Pelotomaculum schinkii TaxID=78350 RepID=UPI00167E8E86|nr:hypothetical protein [Pelotomaculum schinkii]
MSAGIDDAGSENQGKPPAVTPTAEQTKPQDGTADYTHFVRFCNTMLEINHIAQMNAIMTDDKINPLSKTDLIP